MKELLRKYWWVLLLLMALPAIINSCYFVPALNEIFEKPQKWTEFWGTYLSAIASFLMVLITYKTLEQMKKQWDDEHRPQLELYFIKETDIIKGYRIEILNIGKSPAKDIYFDIDSKLLNDIKDENVLEAWKEIGHHNMLSILPNETRCFSLCEKKIDITSKSIYQYKVGNKEVPERIYDKIHSILEKTEKVHIEGYYNTGFYKINADIPTNVVRHSFVGLNETIMGISERLNLIAFSFEQNGLNVNIKKNGTEQQK